MNQAALQPAPGQRRAGSGALGPAPGQRSAGSGALGPAPGQRSAGSGALGLALRVESDPSVRIAFTGRLPAPGADTGNLSLLVGDGDTAGARAAALQLVGATPANAVFMEQVHGGEVAVVTAADAGRGATAADDAVPGVDALVTHAQDLALAVLVADCVPVVLVAPGLGVAAVHAGRGGVAADVVPRAVARLAPDAADDVVAVIGPAVGGCCYEVPAQLAEDVAAHVPAARATTTWGTASLDLPAAVEQQLTASGVADVRRIAACTRCSADEFFSHRATTAAGAPAGRQAAIVLRAGTGGGAAPASPAPAISLESPASP